MKGLYTKKLQEHRLYKELQLNLKSYYELSLHKEYKQKSYLKKFAFQNQSTGEVIKLDYDFEQKYKEYSKTTQQRVSTISSMAHRKDFESVFITFTLPSEYHPFKSIKKGNDRLYTSVNPDFAFDSIDEAVTKGYKKLNKIYQTFYKRVKNYTKQDLFYVKSIEQHNSTIPHLHLLLFFPLDKHEYIKTTYKRVVSHFDLTVTDYQTTNFNESVCYASNYLLKYIIKDLNSGKDYFQARVLDGWKRKHKIRVLSNSNLPLTLKIYKQTYHSISNIEKNKIIFKNNDNLLTVKEKIDIEVATLGIPIYLFIQDNLRLEHKMKCFENSSKTFKKSMHGDKDSLFKVRIEVDRQKVDDKLHYRTNKLVILYENVIIFKKQNYQKIKGDNTNE